MKGKRKPDYGRLVDLLTKAAIKEMIIPLLLPVLSPVVLYFIILTNWWNGSCTFFFGCNVIRCYYTGLFVAVSMTAGGGAWDNAKNILKMEILEVKDLKHINQL